MIAKVTLIVIHSSGRLSATLQLNNYRVDVIVALGGIEGIPCLKALISPHGKVCFQKITLTLDSTLSGLFWVKALDTIDPADLSVT
jgi:hypothetical protein